MTRSSSRHILIVSGFRIFPNSTGGHLRSGNIARAFARMGHRVTLYALAGRNSDYRGAARRAGFLSELIEPDLTEYTNLGLAYGVLQAAGRRLKLPRVWQYALMRMGWVPRSLRAAIESADVVFSDLPWCPPIGRYARRKPWFLISHNLEFKLLEQGVFADRRAAAWMRRVEERVPATYLDVFACAEEDQAFFRARDKSGKQALPIVRNGVDPAAYRAAAGVRESTRTELGLTDADTLLVFSGSNFGPNLDALQTLRAFCNRHAQFLTEKRIWILALGSMTPRASRDGALIATGRVPEVLPYFAAGDAGLNPVMRGSGSNLKLFEYVAAGLPIISTAFGVRGTQLQPDVDYLQYDGDSLLAALEQFIAQPREHWNAIAAQVWERQRAEFDMEVIVREVVQRVPDLAAVLA